MNNKKTSMTNNKFLAFAITSILLINPAYSNDNKAVTLPDVVVTASDTNNDTGYKTSNNTSSMRVDTPLLDTPQSISVVTQDQILDQNITNMTQAAQYVPGVNVQMGEGHRDQITIRGMGGSDKGTTSTFFIDGLRDDAEYIRDFYNIENVEFLKGPNATAFGRGSAGGVVNRVSKFADGTKKRRLVLTGGSFNNRRGEIDLGDKVNDNLSIRLNSMYQKSHSFRDYVESERYGFNPTATIKIDNDTNLKIGYEHFDDTRIVDRGIPSINGEAYTTDNSTFFGSPDDNIANTKLNSFYATLNHFFDDNLELKNSLRYTKNNKFYRNVVPGVISGDNITFSAYQSKIERDNFTNQTDLIKKFETGSLKHTAVVGTEITRQDSLKIKDNGTFSGSSSASLSDPIIYDSVSYDIANTNGKSDVDLFAAYVQDQIEINKYLQLSAGLRFDRFKVKFRNNINSTSFGRNDSFISPRAAIVIKPQESLSIYTSYGVNYVPSSGDQFDSLDSTTQDLKPEKIQNYEIGAKLDINPKLNLSMALYQLDRSNTPADDPDGSGDIVLTGESRTRGLEIALTGNITDKLETIASYAFQDAEITSATTNYDNGNKINLVPRNSFALWNKYNFTSKFAASLGIISQSSQYADASNSVKLQGFTRFDGAIFYKINKDYRLQVNAENLLNQDYIRTAHSANNLMPGAPVSFNATLIANF